MKIFNLLKALTAGLAIAPAIIPLQLSGDLIGAYLDIANGYRQDKYSANIGTFDSKKFLVEQNHFKTDEVSIYQCGAKGEIVLCNLFARGEGYWGWSDKGKYHEATRHLVEAPLKSRGDLKKARTKDFVVGGGYYLPLCLLNIGPSGGWSYQSQEFTVHHAHIQGFDDPCLDGLQYNNRWEGPWAGVDARLSFCDFEFRGGYSYHWATWKGKWQMKDPIIPGASFSETCKSTDANGQTAYLDAIWNMLPYIEVGLGFKWQRWQAKNGHQKSKSCLALSDKKLKDKVKDATWESFAISLLLGVNF